MKKLLIICGLLFSVTFASAQQGGQGGQAGPGRRMMNPEDRVKLLDEKVKLTDDQKTKAVAIYTAVAADQKKAMDDVIAAGTQPDRTAMADARAKMMADTDAKISVILTDDQKKAYKAWQDEQKAAREKRMKERQQGGGAGE